MKVESLKFTSTILFVNWIVVPILFIFIAVRNSFINAMIFSVLWLVVDRVWDWISGLLITGVGKIGASKKEFFDMKMLGDIPARMAAMMILDLFGTLAVPWVIAGFYL